MIVVLFVLHVLISIALIGVVLLQKSEGGALGMGGGGMSGFMTGRSTANLLTRTTAILAAAFMATSILLVVLSRVTATPRSFIDQPSGPAAPLAPTAPSPSSPGTPPTSGTPGTPAAPPPPAGPSAPTTPSAPSGPAAPTEPSAPLAK